MFSMKKGHSEKIQIINKTKGKLPRLPFESMKQEVLRKNYELSLIFIGNALSQKLNKTWRKKDKPTNILSFPLEKNKGEIFINLNLVKKQAPRYQRNFPNFLGFLFIHGLFHLKGMDHSSKIEKREMRIRNMFRI